MRAEEGENQRQPGETAMTKNIDELNAMNAANAERAARRAARKRADRE